VLSDRDLLRGRDRPVDLRERLDALAGRVEASVDEAARGRARETSRRWRRELRVSADDSIDGERVGVLISLAFPERVAQRRRDPGSFLLASGAGASIPLDDPLSREPYLAVAETEGVGADARIRTAAPLDESELEAHHGDRIEESIRGGWDRRARDVVFENQQRLGALVLTRELVSDPDRGAIVDALLHGIRREGLSLLSWSPAARRLRERLEFLHRVDADVWPAVDDASLLDQLEDWLVPRLAGASRRRDLERIDVRDALAGLLDWRQNRDLDRLAPTHLTVPSGSRIPIDYAAESGPVLAVRLQEMFGLDDTPTVGGGEVPIVIHLLSPAHRPVQVTSDLASFWAEGYAAVRKELRGRYPKHEWPEDPTAAAPTKRAKRRS
jgi:ATP-dependent helicase HrpB